MTDLERRIRHNNLRDALASIRRCWASIACGSIPAAIEHRDAATRCLSFTKGLFAHRVSVSATAGLERALLELGDALDAAVVAALRGPVIQASDLVPVIAESLKVLQQRGVEVDDDDIFDRARNAAMTLAGTYRIELINQ